MKEWKLHSLQRPEQFPDTFGLDYSKQTWWLQFLSLLLLGLLLYHRTYRVLDVVPLATVRRNANPDISARHKKHSTHIASNGQVGVNERMHRHVHNRVK